MPSPEQVTAARGLLGWSQTELSEKAALSYNAINSYESKKGNPTDRTRRAIERAFHPYVEFLGTTGVQLKSSDVQIYKGCDEFINFMRNVYDCLKDKGGEVLVANVSERKFEKWLGHEEDLAHMARMKSIKNLYFKVLVEEKDFYLSSSDYAEYRWCPTDRYDDVPFYLYDNKVAFIIFGEEPSVYVLSKSEIFKVFQKQFHSLWAQSQDIPV